MFERGRREKLEREADLSFLSSLFVLSSLRRFFTPIKSVRDNVVKAEKAKIAEKIKKETEEKLRKEKRVAAQLGKAQKWKPGQPIPTAPGLTSLPSPRL